MKTIAVMIFFLFSYQLHAVACICSCKVGDHSLCASSYELDRPCVGICPTTAPSSRPIVRTACPTVQIYNEDKSAYEVKSICVE